MLERVVTVIMFLAERGLAFRGGTELSFSSNTGNYLGCMELLTKFDPFLEEHICTSENAGKGSVSYLPSTICDELVELLASTLHENIVAEVKSAKYYGISINSTPDIGHVDQLMLFYGTL